MDNVWLLVTLWYISGFVFSALAFYILHNTYYKSTWSIGDAIVCIMVSVLGPMCVFYVIQVSVYYFEDK